MSTRRYVSSVRTAAAAAKRGRMIEEAARSLREDASIANFSLDAVAKAAGVTRLTVYNQFGYAGRAGGARPISRDLLRLLESGPGRGTTARGDGDRPRVRAGIS